MSDERYDGGYGSKTLHRMLEFDVVTERHAEFLNNWLNESVQSYKG